MQLKLASKATCCEPFWGSISQGDSRMTNPAREIEPVEFMKVRKQWMNELSDDVFSSWWDYVSGCWHLVSRDLRWSHQEKCSYFLLSFWGVESHIIRGVWRTTYILGYQDSCPYLIIILLDFLTSCDFNDPLYTFFPLFLPFLSRHLFPDTEVCLHVRFSLPLYLSYDLVVILRLGQYNSSHHLFTDTELWFFI